MNTLIHLVQLQMQYVNTHLFRRGRIEAQHTRTEDVVR